MKKNLFKVLSLALVALFAMTCVASAAAVEGIYTDGTVTATVTGIGETDEVTILVVPHGTELASVTSDDILYIDQVTAADGTATFTFTSDTEEIDIYSGYTTMDVAAGALSDIYEAAVVDPEGPEVVSAEIVKDKPFRLSGYQRIFIKLAEGENGAWTPTHSDADSAIYYSTERTGYDGLIKSTAADATAALAEITWENVAPSEDMIIAKYGDVDGTGRVNSDDYISVKNAALRKLTYEMKENVVADVNGDSTVNSDDYIEVKNVALRKATIFTIVADSQQ